MPDSDGGVRTLAQRAVNAALKAAATADKALHEALAARAIADANRLAIQDIAAAIDRNAGNLKELAETNRAILDLLREVRAALPDGAR